MPMQSVPVQQQGMPMQGMPMQSVPMQPVPTQSVPDQFQTGTDHPLCKCATPVLPPAASKAAGAAWGMRNRGMLGFLD